VKLARTAVSLAATALLATGLVAVPTPAYAVTDAELAQRWAPIHHQDTDSSDYDADYLTKINFDGEWTMNNNWDNQPTPLSRLTGHGYYSIAETSTHWFLIYAFYHPRDWSEACTSLNCHENDLEGVLLTIRKNGTAYGRLEAAITVAHTDFYSYVPAGSSFVSGRESVDGTLLTETWGGAAHPSTFQEAKGHGIKRWDGGAPPGGDGVVYQPTTAVNGELPSSGNDRTVAYGLSDIFATSGLWAHRNDSATFASYGTFRGDNYKDNAANAPWRWDDGNDGSDLQAGIMATDPAYLVQQYFDGTGSFSLTYIRNPYGG